MIRRRTSHVAGPVLVALLIAATSGAFGIAQTAQKPTSATPPALDDGWRIGSLEQAGFDRRRIEAMTAAVRADPTLNVHAILIERGGRLVYEEYFSGKDERWGQPIGHIVFTRDTKHDLRSVTKSVVSALVGIAHHSGAIRTLDAPLVEYFPEFKELQTSERRRITLRHALTMSAGFDWNEDIPYTDPKNDEIVMIRSREPMRYVLSRPILIEPGTTWRYNGGLTQVLGTIVQRATKQRLVDYARTVLFEPLGIKDVEWLGNLDGVPSAASGLRLRPRDLAKFASLYVHGGQWNGRQVVPKEWVRESTRRHLTFPKRQERGYAYQWWHACYTTPAGPIDVPTAVGNGSQRIFLLQAHDAAVTALAGRYNDFSVNPPERLLVDFILPAMPAAVATGCPAL